MGFVEGGVKFPQLRAELISYLRSLSDIQYQMDVWVAHLPKEGVVYDEFDYSIHFLYDDTGLAEDPYAEVGEILKSVEEADAIRSLVEAIDRLFAVHGLNLSDEEYIHKSEWASVVGKAQRAQALISESPN